MSRHTIFVATGQSKTSVSGAAIIAAAAGVATNIFRFLSRGKENFSRYDGRVILTTSLGEVTVPLTSETPGSWAVVAKVDNKHRPMITNIIQILERQPELKDF